MYTDIHFQEGVVSVARGGDSFYQWWWKCFQLWWVLSWGENSYKVSITICTFQVSASQSCWADGVLCSASSTGLWIHGKWEFVHSLTLQGTDRLCSHEPCIQFRNWSIDYGYTDLDWTGSHFEGYMPRSSMVAWKQATFDPPGHQIICTSLPYNLYQSMSHLTLFYIQSQHSAWQMFQCQTWRFWLLCGTSEGSWGPHSSQS